MENGGDFRRLGGEKGIRKKGADVEYRTKTLIKKY